MIVGIDVHKHNHAAALIDAHGRPIAALELPNRPSGYRRLIDWLVDHDAAEAVIGVESPGSYGRCLVAALVGAGFEVLQVPAWRTHRERHRRGPGKTDPGDALSIAHVVLRSREDLGPAQEPEVVRALAMLELQRRRFVRDRTQAIQRLRSDWTQHDPVAEAGTLRCDRQRELRKLKRITLGDTLPQRVAARCIRELACDIDDLNHRIATLDAEIADLLADYGTHSRISRAPAPTSPPRSSPRPETSAGSATPARSRASAVQHRSRVGQDKPADATAYTAAATANSTPRSTASRSSSNATTPTPSNISLEKSLKAKHHEKPEEPSNATSPTSSTDASTPGPKTRSQHKQLDIGESNGSSAPS